MTVTAEGLAADQLRRMRAMTGQYHRQFFSDTRWTTLVVVAIAISGVAIDSRLYLLIPFVALTGAVQTAFDASYLIFARQYAARLERFLNVRTEPVLVAAELESRYLFPLDATKVVTIRLGREFSWFGFMTVYYTVLGALAYVTGLALGLDAIAGSARGWYLGSLTALTALSLAAGLWWFAGGVGERRLSGVFEESELLRG